MNIKMQCCGIVLLLVLLYFYIRRKKIKLNTAKAFLRLFVVSIFNLILDTLSIVLLTYHDSIPEIIINIVCKSYISTLILTALSAFLYICTDIYNESREYRKISTAGILSAVLGIILIFILPIYKHCDAPDQVYTYGPSVMTTYIFSAAFLICIVIMLARKRENINPNRWDAMRIWMILWLGSAVTQFFLNELLLVGFSSAIGITIIYLKLENPEVNIDIDTGLFNQNAMLMYTDQLHRRGKVFSIIELIFPSSMNLSSSDNEYYLAQKEISSYLSEIDGAYTFKNDENQAILIFEDKEQARQYLSVIKRRFEFGWGIDGNTYLNPAWIYMPDGCIVNNAEDIIPLLSYAELNGKNHLENGIIVIREKLLAEMYAEKSIEMLIFDALEHNRIEVFYQPIFSTRQQRFTSAEALVRIRNREGKIIPPNTFIPVAEKNGTIMQLGEAVFEKVCLFLNEHKPEQYGLAYIEINLSVVQCAYEHLAESFIYIMNKYQIPPQWINLEITESASVREKDILLNNMKALINHGVRFSLDDFGTGQSNLNYIVEMPVDIVKFDRSMILAYFENGKAKYVMDAAMHMIHGMELKIVSEGIETKEQYETMKELGISYIQGYYFSKPLPESEFLNFISQE